MKLPLARLMKWFLVLVGIVACLCFEISWYFQNESTYNSPFYVGLAIRVAHFLPSFFLFCFVVALLVFLFQKIFLASLKKWKLIWIGVLAGLGLGVGDFLYRCLLLTNPNVPPCFYAQPYTWLMKAIDPMVTSQEQRAHSGMFLITLTLSYFIYFAVLGVFLGFLLQCLFWMFQKLKRHDPTGKINA